MTVARKSIARIWPALVVLVAVYFCALPVANALIVGCNIDVHNNTGKDAHDFHIKGIIESSWCRPTLAWQFGWIANPADTFPNFTHSITHIGGDDYEFEAEWSSRNVNPSEVGHFGIFFNVCGKNVFLHLDGWWTDQGGNKIPSPNGNGWPIPGFEVPNPDEMFRLQGDAGEEQIPLQIQAMDLALVDEPQDAEAMEELLSRLNAQEVGLIGAEWVPAMFLRAEAMSPDAPGVKVEDLPRDLPPGAASFFEVPLKGLIDRSGPMDPHDLLISMIEVSWEDEEGGRLVFHVHEVQPPPTSVNPRRALATMWGSLKTGDR